MYKKKITVLAGGVGAARFLEGLMQVIPPETVSVIVNTGDDEEFFGLYVCPDIDIITYTLAGLVNKEHGWGISGDTFACLSMLAQLGHPTWFNLGDRDVGVHIHRTYRKQQGWELDKITGEIAQQLGVTANITPMTNNRVCTKIRTGKDILPFQKYFVERRAQDPVNEILFNNIEESLPAPGVIESILSAEVVILAPSNPYVSIGPILAVPGIRDAMQSTDAPVVAISPIVQGAAIKGPAARMMKTLGDEVSSLGVARLYRDFLDLMIIDVQDAELKGVIENSGIRTLVTDTIMSSLQKKEQLATTILDGLE